MTGWWVHDFWNAGLKDDLISWIFWVLFSITLHELAHGWMATIEGDDTPKRTGHLTANPVVHMGIPSIVIFLIIGIAWGLMPVNPNKFKHGRVGRILVAAAGPVMNLLLAIASLTILGFIIDPTDDSHTFLETFLFVGGKLNILLAIFNLLPIPPLDGSTILANLSNPIARLYANPQAGFIGLFLMLAIFMSNTGSLVFTLSDVISSKYVAFIFSFLN